MDEDEDDVAQEDEDNKRGELLHVLAVKADCIFCKILSEKIWPMPFVRLGINDDMDESEYSARDSKRPKRE